MKITPFRCLLTAASALVPVLVTFKWSAPCCYQGLGTRIKMHEDKGHETRTMTCTLIVEDPRRREWRPKLSRRRLPFRDNRVHGTALSQQAWLYTYKHNADYISRCASLL